MINSFQGKFRFLSNFYPCLVEQDGYIYHSVEHAYQSAKTLISSEKKVISLAKTPGDAKRLGKKVTLRGDWDFVKDNKMLELLRQKFMDFSLSQELLDTENEELIEGNFWHDNYWGS